MFVAPSAALTGAPHEQMGGQERHDQAASPRPGRDEVDGVRTWRQGDELTAIHWPATLRSGEFVVRERLNDEAQQWTVQAVTGTADADVEAARVRATLEHGLAAGATVAVRVDDGVPTVLPDRDSVLRWAAAFEPDGARHCEPALRWWQRPVALPSPEPERTITPRARWMVAGAAAIPPIMLLEPLGYGLAQIGAVVLAIAVSALLTAHWPGLGKSARQACGLLGGVAVGAVLIDLSAIDGVLTSLRFLLPQTLVALVVVQGFECVDRRSARVTLACAAMLTAYAAGIRVDDRLAWWLGISLLALLMASHAITRTDRGHTSVTARLAATRTGLALVAAFAVLAVLAAVPIPEGPAQLTLPSWLEDYRPTPGDGQLVAANGSPLVGGASVTNRSGNGTGGYPGFSPTMDTSLRGSLGNDVVLRVRAPFADFWRGQTFTKFDGRSWTVDDETGVRTEGPDHAIEPAIGDVRPSNDDQFIQTFYAEVDLPNIVFAASRAERVLLEAPLWARPDGALRADVVLPAGSAYTVVSQRSGATAAGLRADGDLADDRTPVAYVEVPESTTQRTRALAQQLAAPTTYDTIIAIQAWLAQHVSYDLDAPVPPDGADAVDDFLFESRTGFCEQIATATAILLRTLGVPTRIATGYVPSERDDVAGVWVSRASDAHAWVEVRFPDFGWVAFDPTASVPLSGEAELSSIGGDLAKSLARAISNHISELLTAVLVAAGVFLVGRCVRGWWQRRCHGEWGVLQDRFVATALRRGAHANAPNVELAAVFRRPAADELAATLDACAFSDTWIHDDELYRHSLAALRELEHSH
jgi:transglutaminase-like putative cysteine protease